MEEMEGMDLVSIKKQLSLARRGHSPDHLLEQWVRDHADDLLALASGYENALANLGNVARVGENYKRQLDSLIEAISPMPEGGWPTQAPTVEEVIVMVARDSRAIYPPFKAGV